MYIKALPVARGSELMSEKRKDSKGRILKTGESERKNGLYQYRYQDANGIRRTVYASTLKDLRAKEQEIEAQTFKGVKYFEGATPLSEFLDSLFTVKQNWRDSTRESMLRYLTIVKKSPLYTMQIAKIKPLDCKMYLVDLKQSGYSYGTIATVFALLKMAFESACENDILAKNPCGFQLKSVIEDDTPKVEALSTEQVDSLLKFLAEDTYGKRHLDMVTVLLGTGLRISEFAALTVRDIDFSRNVIYVRKQIQRLKGRVVITKPKSKYGVRDIPMTTAVRHSLQNLLEARKGISKEVMIDGYIGFLVVTRNGRPRTGPEYADALRLLITRYNESSTIPIGHCTPHVFRHTFCTRCISSGMDVKTVQYLMGHSDASTTLNVYTDTVSSEISQKIKLLEVNAG